MTRHYISAFGEFPMPALRGDAYYGDYMLQARKELAAARYAFDDKDGREFEHGQEVSRYSNPADYNQADYRTRADIFDCVFARAIKSRAARLANLARWGARP